MKAFFEEYGRILVSALVILLFVVSASPLGGSIKDGITGVVQSMNRLGSNGEGSGGNGGSNEETGEAFAIYSADDNSLRFYKDETVPVANQEGGYNNLAVTEVYTGIEEDIYSFDPDSFTSSAPWFNNAQNIVRVVVEDSVSPVSTAGWFCCMLNCTFLDITNLNTSKVTDMSGMFMGACGYPISSYEAYEIKGLSEMDTSNVTNMSYMLSLTSISDSDISGWDVSSVTDMHDMFFNSFGSNMENFKLDLSGWDVSSVTNMSEMFREAGRESSTFELDLLGWDVSSVTDMNYMFERAGEDATTFKIRNISNWNTCNVLNMAYMFADTGRNAEWSLDCSNWNVNKVISYSGFNNSVTSKVTPPTWVN